MTGELPEYQLLQTLKDQTWLRSEHTQRVLRILEDGGFEARVVGGAVRNALMGRPIKDIDIATTAEPNSILELAQTNGLKAIATGIAHGTVTVISGGIPYEVTTLRKDVSTDGRHAVVAFTDDWLADAQRRDFTINAMFCDRHGKLFDPVNGLSDIVARQVRFVGQPRKRIEEDYLRSLRFFRFFAEYGQGQPDRSALADIVSCRNGLKQLSAERIRQEFLKILVAPRAVEIIQVMHEFGLLHFVLPVVPRLSHFARLCGSYKQSGAVIRLAVIGVCTHEDSKRLAQHLRLSNAEADVLEHVATVYSELRKAPSVKLARNWLYNEGKVLFDARVSAMHSSSFRQLADPTWTEVSELPINWQPPEFPLSGRIAIELGAAPGPDLGRQLSSIKEHWVANDFEPPKEELIAMLKSQIGKA